LGICKVIEVAAAVGGALLTACFVSVGSISYRGRQSRDDLVRNTTAIELLTDKIDTMHEDMREVFCRLKEVELAVVELKPRQ
tara:strand:- start:899 stop:1144 length:246 start_codon:yes stop_codon:yes gene_type:complete